MRKATRDRGQAPGAATRAQRAARATRAPAAAAAAAAAPAAPAPAPAARAARATIEGLLTAALLALLVTGCDSEDPPRPPPGDTACGSGQATLQIGDGNPFEQNPEQTYLLEAGRQGGFHTHVSLRAQGALDPDYVDVHITLKDGDAIIAQHVTTEWLLSIDVSGPYCEYPVARLILVDEEGGLFDREAALAVAGRPLTLEARIESQDGDAVATETIRLDGSDL